MLIFFGTYKRERVCACVCERERGRERERKKSRYEGLKETDKEMDRQF